jgi:hypothetical protein
MASKWILAWPAWVLFTVLACLRPPPVIEYRVYAPAKSALDKVAVAPFDTHVRIPGSASTAAPSAGAAASHVEHFVAEEIAARGVEVVPAGDVGMALAARGKGTQPIDPSTAAQIVLEKFGATAVLLGEVTRYRERAGGKRGSPQPAGVGFRISLHAAPSGKRLWTARFDETQVSLSEAPGRARRYPGGGTRWLTAAELARFGAQKAAEALVASP